MASKLRTHEVPISGWVEPIDAYARLTEHQPMLLDGMGAHPEARYAYVALHQKLEARIVGRTRTVSHDDGAVESQEGDPVALLAELLEAWKFDEPLERQAGFAGGFVGYVGYEFAHALEPTLPAPKKSATPDVALRLYRDVLVFDRRNKTVCLRVTDLPGETGARQRCDAIREALTRHQAPDEPFRGKPLQWRPSMDSISFQEAVASLKTRIANGDLFQANLATRFQAPMDTDAVALYRAVQANNPSPYMALMEWGDHTILSNSPEQLFAVEGNTIRARPIAGTRRRDADPARDAAMEEELLHDPKEQAEHTMLVDLVRNDIARIAQAGTVRVTERGSVERYQRVMHLVSCVEGKLKPSTDFIDWLAALFPGGTITGAPKHRACLRIHELEPVARGPYTGSAGYLSWDQRTTHWNIMIRTLLVQDGKASVHAGSGIVMGSDPAREWKEAGHKARALLDSAAGTRDPATRIGEVTRHGEWMPPRPSDRIEARVLLVDNYDSFVHNLADYCSALGAEVSVVRNDEDIERRISDWSPTHVILSPGPGWPEEAGGLVPLAKSLLGRIPLLGVCLGHQALAQAVGASVVIAGKAVHGETDAIDHEGGLLDGLPSPFTATRYHSLVVDPSTLPKDWTVTARLTDGTVMAMEHVEHAAFGVQFHPESIGTPLGLDILIRFLSTTGRGRNRLDS